MKVIHVVTRLQRGGSERNLLNLLERELRAGHSVTLATGHVDPATIVPAGADVVVVPGLQRRVAPMADGRVVLALRALIRRGAYDVVFTHQSKAGVVGRLAARRATARRVHYVHMPSFGQGYGRLSGMAFRLLERVCARWTDLFVSVGSDVRARYLAAGVGVAERFLVLPSPVDLDAFATLRHRTRRPDPARIACVAVVGALERRKRTELALRRLAPLLAAGEARLVIAGDGHERPRLERIAEDLGIGGAVAFLGHVDDLVPVLADADVLAHCALIEGVPQVVVQALAAGVPVVTATRYGIGDLPACSALVQVDPHARKLAHAVRSTLAERPSAVDLELLAPWRPERVAAGVDALLSWLDGDAAAIGDLSRRGGHRLDAPLTAGRA